MRDDTRVHPQLQELKETLKPCPFCGGKAALHMHNNKDDYLYGRRWWYSVMCSQDCGGQTAGRVDLVSAVEMWNRRTVAVNQPTT